MVSEGIRFVLMKKIAFVVILLLTMVFMQISLYAVSKQDFYNLFVDPKFGAGRNVYTEQFLAAMRDFLNTNDFSLAEYDVMYQEVLDIKNAWRIDGDHNCDEAHREMLLNMTVVLARGVGGAISVENTYNGWTVSVVSRTGRVYTFVNLCTPVVDPRWVEANEGDGFLNPIKATGPGLDFRQLYIFAGLMAVMTVSLVYWAIRECLINRFRKICRKDAGMDLSNTPRTGKKEKIDSIREIS